MILYIWKIIHGLVPDPGLTYAPTNSNNGVMLKPPKIIGPGAVRKLKEHSLLYHGVRLYNCMPSYLHNSYEEGKDKPISLDTFKHRINKVLELIPDQPFSSKRQRKATTNSILDQIKYKMEPKRDM